MKYIESDNLELKELINNDFKKEIVAFANTAGGEIYVGIDSNGDIVGVEDAEKDMERISSMIRDGIRPDLIPYTSVELLYIETKKIIRVTVSRGEKIPYHLRDKGLKPSGVYVRHGVTSIPASEEMIRNMIRQSDGVVFDKARSINQELTFNYANEYFLKKDVQFEAVNKKSLGLIDADGFYTNAALLLSDQCEHNIKCAVFEGEGKTKFKTRKEFLGSILKQLEDTYEYISLMNNVHADFKGLERVETFDYPQYALREALLNTIVHRDYNYSGSSIINIFSDRIEFVSIGGLVKGITLTDIMHGVSQPRNEIIANIFYRLKLIESYGTGIQRILESYAGSAPPEFLVGNASFVSILPKFRVLQFQKHENTDESPEEKVIDLIQNKGEITRKNVEELLGCSSFPARKIITSLIEKNVIISIGLGRATKYRLSEK